MYIPPLYIHIITLKHKNHKRRLKLSALKGKPFYICPISYELQKTNLINSYCLNLPFCPHPSSIIIQFSILVNNLVEFTLGRHHFLCYTYLIGLIRYAYWLRIYLLLLGVVENLLIGQKIYFFVSFLSRLLSSNTIRIVV